MEVRYLIEQILGKKNNFRNYFDFWETTEAS